MTLRFDAVVFWIVLAFLAFVGEMAKVIGGK
jgi:hypothetical protein